MSSILGCKTEENSSPLALLTALNDQLSKLVSAQEITEGRLMKQPLTQNEHDVVQSVGEALQLEYKGRKEMILKRLDATRQTFCWSDAVQAEMVPKINYFVEHSFANTNCAVPAQFGYMDVMVADSCLISELALAPVSHSITPAKGDVIRNYVLDPTVRIADKGGRTKLTPTAKATTPTAPPTAKSTTASPVTTTTTTETPKSTTNAPSADSDNNNKRQPAPRRGPKKQEQGKGKGQKSKVQGSGW